jgi:hypothetical protein
MLPIHARFCLRNVIGNQCLSCGSLLRVYSTFMISKDAARRNDFTEGQNRTRI